MSDISWAVQQMKNGEKVRLEYWGSNAYIFKSGDYYYDWTDNKYCLDSGEMEADTWELFEIRDINWVIRKLNEGFSVRLKGWHKDHRIYKEEFDLIMRSWRCENHCFTYEQIKSTNWEIYKE